MVVREITLAVGVDFDFPVIYLDKWKKYLIEFLP